MAGKTKYMHLTFIKHGFLTILLLFVMACGGSGGDSVQIEIPAKDPPPSNSPSTGTLQERLDAVLAGQSASAAGVSVLVIKDDEVVYHQSKGMADRNAGIAINNQTGFRLASVSKSFTALAIMQLVEAEQLSLNDPVRNHIPELPGSWQPITVEMLLTHESGIYDLLNDNWQSSLVNRLTNGGAINHFIENPGLEFPPGSRADYSNSGYILLAETIERVTGYNFSDYMRLYIFEPAGMAHSYINDELQPLRTGDALNFGNSQTHYGITTWLSGNMGQVSSTDDFIHFFNALRNGELVSSSTLSAMAFHRTTVFGSIKYGYGFMLGTTSYGHGGMWDSFRTDMTIDPALSLEFVVLTNGGGSTQSYIGAVREVVYGFY